MNDNEHGLFWVAWTLGAMCGIVALTLLLIFGDAFSGPSIHDGDCIIVTAEGDILHDPRPGEDDGLVYCPTGEVSVSQIGDVVK